jgi:hypothetical protein
MLRGWLILAAVLALLLYASFALAQTLEAWFPDGVPGYDTAQGVTVLSRLRPLYQAPGMRLGSFLLQPLRESDFGYDSNVLGGQPGKGSWVLGTRANLLATSDWSRGAVGAYASVDNARFLDTPAQSRTNWTASLGATLPIGRDQLTLAAAHLSLHEDRSDIDALPTDQPVSYQVNDARAAYVMKFNRLSLTPNLEVSSYRYGNTTILGVPASQAYRNRNVVQGGVTARYDLDGLRNALLVLQGVNQTFIAPQPAQPSSNSNSLTLLAGISDDTSAVWRYRLLIGWEVRAFAAPQYKTHSAPIAIAEVIWAPSGLTTVSAWLTRTIEDAAQEGVAGYTLTGARLVVDHEYLRNVLLQGSLGLQHASYLQAAGSQTSATLGASVTWLVNRNMRLTASYDFTGQRGTGSTLNTGPTLNIGSTLATGNFVRSIGLLTLRFDL